MVFLQLENLHVVVVVVVVVVVPPRFLYLELVL